MDNCPAVSHSRNLDRLHQATAGFRPVARVDINVSAPQAGWTMIGVAITNDKMATIATNEGFFRPLESLAHLFFVGLTVISR